MRTCDFMTMKFERHVNMVDDMPDQESPSRRASPRPRRSLPDTLIVGLGSAHGDDQFGWRVAEQLASAPAMENLIVRKARSPAELLDWLAGIERLIVCDACQSLGSPGRVHRWFWPEAELSTVGSSGSHDLSLPSALALAHELGQLPPFVLIVAAEERRHGAAGEPSPEVAAAVPRTVELILREVTAS
jgi:hydrogenase maturation protease